MPQKSIELFNQINSEGNYQIKSIDSLNLEYFSSSSTKYQHIYVVFSWKVWTWDSWRETWSITLSVSMGFPWMREPKTSISTRKQNRPNSHSYVDSLWRWWIGCNCNYFHESPNNLAILSTLYYCAIYSFQSTKAESKLKCFLRASDLPFYFTKEELFNKNPGISVFHDVITEEDLRQLSNCTSARVSKTQVVSHWYRIWNNI